MLHDLHPSVNGLIPPSLVAADWSNPLACYLHPPHPGDCQVKFIRGGNFKTVAELDELRL